MPLPWLGSSSFDHRFRRAVPVVVWCGAGFVEELMTTAPRTCAGARRAVYLKGRLSA